MGDMKWYVLRTAGSKEKKAKDYLEKEIVALWPAGSGRAGSCSGKA